MKKNLDIDNFYFNKTKNKLYNKCKSCIKQNKPKDAQPKVGPKRSVQSSIYPDQRSEDTRLASDCNRTLIVGPCFCGKTYLMLNKIIII